MSRKGTEEFLACHYRLAKMTRSFVPYGTTLFVALLIAEATDTFELADELELPATQKLLGRQIHCVGTRSLFQTVVDRLSDRLESCTYFGKKPRPGILYAAGVALMAEADDNTIYTAYERLYEMLDRE